MRRFLSSLLFKRRLLFKAGQKRKCQEFQEALQRVSVAQVRFQSFKRARDFYEYLSTTVEKAREEDTQLVCFPLGMERELQPLAWNEMNEEQRKEVYQACDRAFEAAAKEFEIHIASSTIREGVFRSRIWKPDGTCLEGKHIECCGKKLFFSQYDFEYEDEGDMHIFARFGSMFGKKISKAWLDAQQGYVFTVESKMVGNYAIHGEDTFLKGRSGIYAPLELTPFGDGILALAEDSQSEELITADLNFESLSSLRESLEDEKYKNLLV